MWQGSQNTVCCCDPGQRSPRPRRSDTPLRAVALLTVGGDSLTGWFFQQPSPFPYPPEPAVNLVSSQESFHYYTKDSKFLNSMEFFGGNLYLLIFRERKGRRENKKHRLVVPLTYAFIGRFYMCPDWDRTCSLGVSGQHSNQLSYLSKANFMGFRNSVPKTRGKDHIFIFIIP